MELLPRASDIEAVEIALRRFPVVGIIGARQVGKTTLSRVIGQRHGGSLHHFDLENPEDRARLQEPMLALKRLQGLVVLDEVQRLPEMFPVLRVLADRPDSDTRFLVLGSASPELLRQGSESLAGRIHYHELRGLSVADVGVEHLDTLWLRGGFPRSFLAANLDESVDWRRAFLRTFLERDLRQLGIGIPAESMRRFWSMIAHRHGQLWNASDFARSFGVADTTVRRYLDALTASLVVVQLPAWHENISKRQVKAPKVFVADSGLLHALLGIADREDLEGYPLAGASWEGFVMEKLLRHIGARPDEAYFWATHAGAELDLLVVRGRHRLGFEIKRSATPRTTKSMHVAMQDLNLERLDVIHAGEHTFPLAGNIRAVAARRMFEDLEPMCGGRTPRQ